MYKTAILTISDRCAAGKSEDKTGIILQDLIKEMSFEVCSYEIIADDKEGIQARIIEICDDNEVDLLLTNGGTGFGERDNTPEATLAVIDRIVPGIPEVMRAESLKITPRAMLSRSVAGLRGKTLIVNLPGSPKGAKESLEAILPALEHRLDMIAGKDH